MFAYRLRQYVHFFLGGTAAALPSVPLPLFVGRGLPPSPHPRFMTGSVPQIPVSRGGWEELILQLVTGGDIFGMQSTQHKLSAALKLSIGKVLGREPPMHPVS